MYLEIGLLILTILVFVGLAWWYRKNIIWFFKKYNITWKKLLAIITGAAIIGGGLLVIGPPEPVDPPAAWWNSNWDYYKTCYVANKIDDYQMKIIVGNSTGGNVTCDGHANANFSDLRFVYDNTTELPYWIENYMADTQATIWVNNSGNYSSFEMFYGNSAVGNNGDGNTTFDFFDDFPGTSLDTSKWTTQDLSGDGAYAVADSKVHLTASTTSTNWVIINTEQFSKAPCALRLLGVTADGIGAHQLLLDPDTGTTAVDYVRFEIWDQTAPNGGGNSDVRGYVRWDGSGAEVYRDTDVGDTYAVNNMDICIPSNRKTLFYVNGVLKGTATDALDDETWRVKLRSGRSDRGAHSVYVGTVIFRKYADTEPSWGAFGSEQSAPEEWSNTAPTFSNPNPTNQTTGISLQPTVNVTITDADGNQSTCDFYTSTDGSSWTHQQTNTSVLNQSIQYSYTQADNYNTTYYWKVTANDTHDNSSAIYHFTTGGITVSNEQPTNGSTGISFNPWLNITIGHMDDDSGVDMNVTFRTNATGSWGDIGTNSSVNNGTYCWTNSSMNSYSTIYYWSVNISDGHGTWANETYHFTTESVPVTRSYIDWDTTYQWAKHAYDDALYLAQHYGQYNLTPLWDNSSGMYGTELYPHLLPVSLAMYKITHNSTYLDRARGCADDIQNYMLNTTTNIIRVYNNDTGVDNTTQTRHNAYYLIYLADLAIYDSNYVSLAENVSQGIIDYFISNVNAIYRYVYPNGTVADVNCRLPSNGGALSIGIKGLLRTYEATGNTTILNKAYDVLTSVWTNAKTGVNLIPTIFDGDDWTTVDDNCQQYAAGELLGSYCYYYALTGNPTIKNIVGLYSDAIYNYYWDATDSGEGHFVYEVDVDTGSHYYDILEINWHKLEMPLWYAGEINNTDFSEKIGKNANTSWLKDWGGTIDYGLTYIDTPGLFRHGTTTTGGDSTNDQSLIYATLRSALYSMLRLQKQGMYTPNATAWNIAIYNHVNLTQYYHNKTVYMYHNDIDTDSPYGPDAYGTPDYVLHPSAGTFASVITLLFNTSSNVDIQWQNWSNFYTTEPFSEAYDSCGLGYMDNVTFDYDDRYIIFDKVTSSGAGKINVTAETISQVTEDDVAYDDWYNPTGSTGMINTSDGTHKYVIVLSGGTLPGVIYNTTIRNDGIDYFVWLGGNTTASVVDNNITGFDEAAENISIWRNGTWGGSGEGNWITWTGTGGGTDFNIKTFDVVRVYLTDSGTQTFNMTPNPGINYGASRTVTLLNDSITKGGNYTGYTDIDSTNLSNIATAITLDAGEYICLWNETNYDWDWFIVGFYEPNVAVHLDDVIFTKVADTESWEIGGR